VLRVAAPPARPLMVFDGTCGFCRRWVRRWQQATGDAVDYLPSQDVRVSGAFPEIAPDRLASAIHFIEPDGRVSAGAEAVFRALAVGGASPWPLRGYRRVPLVAPVSELCYRSVARHRHAAGRLTTWLWGRHVERPTYQLVRWLFLRGLGVIYFVAFASLWVQILGLVGSHGILPVGQLMDGARQYVDAQQIGVGRYYLLPTLSWVTASDASLVAECATGVGLAVLVIADVAPGVCLLLLWLLYLSIVTIGGDFLAFQWDSLLLEAGLLAVFFAPWRWGPRFIGDRAPSRLARGLLLWLLFRLMFESGCVKLLSGDASWRNLTALTYHYQTQPLPTWIGWYAHQLPVWFQKLSCLLVFVVEIGAPFLIVAPRRLRMAGAAALIGLQALILLTGNYTFFNWLAIALCLLLFDDAALARLLPARLRARVEAGGASRPAAPHPRWYRAAAGAAAAVVVAASLGPLAQMFGVESAWLAPVDAVDQALAPLRSVNGYGLFAIMTTSRPEITIEGSDDGETWRAYTFRYKPGDVDRRPAFVAPYQPRLDWQMWFAALGTARGNPWFTNLCVRLLQGSPSVLGLLGPNPFPDHPPRYVRAIEYDYRFTTVAERRATGAWWVRSPAGDYLPAISLSR
jgi:predicted DCC family thiol-disulfide oxidoreductase YuxK